MREAAYIIELIYMHGIIAGGGEHVMGSSRLRCVLICPIDKECCLNRYHPTADA